MQALSLGPLLTTRKVMYMHNIPFPFREQLGSIFRVSGDGIPVMKKRTLRLDGHDVKLWLELPPPNSKQVMLAHVLITYARVEVGSSHFKKQPILSSDGSRVTYSFNTWEQFGSFLTRLPRRLPSKVITELYDECGRPLTLSKFFFKFDRDWGYYTVRHFSISSMQKIQPELLSVGLRA